MLFGSRVTNILPIEITLETTKLTDKNDTYPSKRIKREELADLKALIGFYFYLN